MRHNAILRICTYSVLIFALLLLMATVMFRPRWTETTCELGPVEGDGKPHYYEFQEPITGMDIEWPAGEVLIETGDVDGVKVTAGNGTADVHVTPGGCLEVRYEENLGKRFFVKLAKKGLTITVPKDTALNKLDLDVASANVTVRGLEGDIREVEINSASGISTLENLKVGTLDVDTASGPCRFDNLTVRDLNVDTASGNVSFTGQLDTLNYDGASAWFTGVFLNHPYKLNLNTMSGKLDITLPEDCGFTAAFDGMSGKLNSDFATTFKNNAQVFGDGGCYIQVDSMSGNLTIRKSNP